MIKVNLTDSKNHLTFEFLPSQKFTNIHKLENEQNIILSCIFPDTGRM